MSSLAFQMPDKVFVEKIDHCRGVFSFRPLEKGYGSTIGNSLRRVLISSLEGYAITSIKVSGVRHEFSTIDGVQEDLVAMILNLKQVRLKKIVEGEHDPILVNIHGHDFTAKDIGNATSSFEVLNPDLLICRVDESASFDIELQIVKHRGFLSADENKSRDMPLDVIPIDAIFSPIVKASYHVEDMRVGKRIDYEQLILEVETDGSITPEESIQQAAGLIIAHLQLLYSEGIALENVASHAASVVDDEASLSIKKNLYTPISELNCSSRVFSCLTSAGIETLLDLVRVKDFDAIKFRNFGKRSRSEVDKLLEEKNLQIGMDLSKYNLDDPKV